MAGQLPPAAAADAEAIQKHQVRLNQRPFLSISRALNLNAMLMFNLNAMLMFVIILSLESDSTLSISEVIHTRVD